MKPRHGRFGPCTVTLCSHVPQRWYAPWRIFLRRRVRLLFDLKYTRPDGSEYIVKAGLESDGPSFPLFVAFLLPTRLDCAEAGFYHDDLCRKCAMCGHEKDKHEDGTGRCTYEDDDGSCSCTGFVPPPQAWCDAEFREALCACKVGEVYSYICYFWLRLVDVITRWWWWFATRD